MGVFNNREIAVAIWAVILLCLFLLKKKQRTSIYDLFSTIFSDTLIPYYFWTIIYTSLGILIFYQFDMWKISELKDSIIWLLFSGLFSIGKAIKSRKEKNFFKEALKKNIHFTVLVEFIVGLYSFSLPIEFILIPAVAKLRFCK